LMAKRDAGPRQAPEAASGFELLPAEEVGGDLGTELDELKLGLDPRHGASCLECITDLENDWGSRMVAVTRCMSR
jgi:hypothetical protein